MKISLLALPMRLAPLLARSTGTASFSCGAIEKALGGANISLALTLIYVFGFAAQIPSLSSSASESHHILAGPPPVDSVKPPMNCVNAGLGQAVNKIEKQD